MRRPFYFYSFPPFSSFRLPLPSRSSLLAQFVGKKRKKSTSGRSLLFSFLQVEHSRRMDLLRGARRVPLLRLWLLVVCFLLVCGRESAAQQLTALRVAFITGTPADPDETSLAGALGSNASWAMTVTMLEDTGGWDQSVLSSNYDVVYISQTVLSGNVRGSPKFAAAADIGSVVGEQVFFVETNLNDLWMCTGSQLSAATADSLVVLDDAHPITCAAAGIGANPAIFSGASPYQAYVNRLFFFVLFFLGASPDAFMCCFCI